MVCPPCVSTSGQRKFAPPYEILNTPLVYIYENVGTWNDPNELLVTGCPS